MPENTGNLPANDSDDVRAHIMNAASDRFRHYGYGKTTMAEIARDCSMSAGNLYRYFESKSDIGAAVCACWFRNLEQTAENAVARDDLSPAEKLEAYVLAVCRRTLDSCLETPHIREMVDFLTQEQLDLLNDHTRLMSAIVRRIIEEGVRRGDFAAQDTERAARTIQIAIVHFKYPPLISMCDWAMLETEAKAVVAMLVRGLRA